jgi:hypothetical protein
MKKIDLKVEPLKYVSEESFKPYGQIFGLEKGKPTEDYSFLKCWWKNINVELTGNEKIGYNYCTAKRITSKEVVELKFLLDTSLSVSIRKGTWHWPPIPKSFLKSIILTYIIYSIYYN